MSNLSMLPKLHKSKRINEIIQKQQCEFRNTEEIIIVKARPIAAGSVYHSSSISEILHIIVESSLAMISHITKDSFAIKNRLDKHCPTGTTHLVPVILNHYILTFDMIFFIQQLNTGLKNCKMIYRYCNV